MRTLFILILAALTALSLRLSFAETAPSAKADQGVATTKPEARPQASLENLTGEVRAVDREAKRLTVKKSGWFTSKEMTFTVADQATPKLDELRPGDEVTVGYIETQGQLIASTISRTPTERMGGK